MKYQKSYRQYLASSKERYEDRDWSNKKHKPRKYCFGNLNFRRFKELATYYNLLHKLGGDPTSDEFIQAFRDKARSIGKTMAKKTDMELDMHKEIIGWSI